VLFLSGVQLEVFVFKVLDLIEVDLSDFGCLQIQELDFCTARVAAQTKWSLPLRSLP